MILDHIRYKQVDGNRQPEISSTLHDGQKKKEEKNTHSFSNSGSATLILYIYIMKIEDPSPQFPDAEPCVAPNYHVATTQIN